MNHFVSTEFIVLKKISYMESSLIVSGLSPDVGKIDFIFKGAKKISKSSLPEVDYFRIFSVSYYDRAKGLTTPTTLELLKNYDIIANNPEKLTEVFGIVPFILKNKHYGIACPILYKSLLRYIDSTAKNKPFQQFFIKLAYLYENGLLPEELAHSQEDQQKNKNFLSLLINLIINDRNPPVLPKEYCLKLEQWINSLCLLSELC